MGRKHKSRRQLLDKGIAAAAIGAVMLLAPQMLGAGSRSLAMSVQLPALFALLLGVALIVLHFLARRAAPPDTVPQQPQPDWRSWAPPQALAARAGALPFGAVPAFVPTLAAQPPPPSRRPPQAGWNARVLQDIEWRRFEALCEQLFAQAGLATRSESRGHDAGLDIWLHSRHAPGPAALVRCKHGAGRPIDVFEVRELFGLMAAHQIKRGTYATTSSFTLDAAQFARENGINALDAGRLLALIARRTPGQQAQLLATAYEGEYWRPTCGRCGTKMVERRSQADGSRFWGCPRYPQCTWTLPAAIVS